MIWIYRIAAIGLVGWGAYLLSNWLSPPEGLEILVPSEAYIFVVLSLVLAPAVVNLVNSFLGSWSGLLRWGVVVLNAGLVAFGVFESVRSGLETDTAWILTTFLVLLIFSTLLARSWGNSSKGAEEVG
jgi:hypothetical protein